MKVIVFLQYFLWLQIMVVQGKKISGLSLTETYNHSVNRSQFNDAIGWSVNGKSL